MTHFLLAFCCGIAVGTIFFDVLDDARRWRFDETTTCAALCGIAYDMGVCVARLAVVVAAFRTV